MPTKPTAPSEGKTLAQYLTQHQRWDLDEDLSRTVRDAKNIHEIFWHVFDILEEAQSPRADEKDERWIEGLLLLKKYLNLGYNCERDTTTYASPLAGFVRHFRELTERKGFDFELAFRQERGTGESLMGNFLLAKTVADNPDILSPQGWEKFFRVAIKHRAAPFSEDDLIRVTNYLADVADALTKHLGLEARGAPPAKTVQKPSKEAKINLLLQNSRDPMWTAYFKGVFDALKKHNAAADPAKAAAARMPGKAAKRGIKHKGTDIIRQVAARSRTRQGR